MEEHVPDSHPLPGIDLDLPRKLEDPVYRERFFLAEASADIARQLIALRKRRDLNQTELAERAGTQQPAVSRAEQADYQNWSFNTLRKLTNAMGGRLRVVIDAWEDVLPEYYPDEHKPIVLPQKPQNSEKERKTRENKSPTSAAEESYALRLNALREWLAKDWNREEDVSALRELRPPQRDRPEHGCSQWS
jgi:transcriptional regulator with XRE-family HTH domain